jgi:hypothetical protein
MLYFGAAELNAALAAQPQAKAEIDVLEIAKEALIEPAGRAIGVAGVKGSGSAWGEDLAVIGGQRADGRARCPAPRRAEDGIDVAEAVHAIGLPRIQLGRAEHIDARVAQGGAAQLFEPGFAGDGVGVEHGDPVRLAIRHGEIVGGGEAEIGMGEVQPEAAVGKPQRLGRAVARIIVDDDRLEVGNALRGERVDAILQQWAGIVIDDDHAHPGRGTLNHLALHQLPLAYSLQE